MKRHGRLAKIDYLKITKDDMDIFAKRSWYVWNNDGQIYFDFITEETYFKNLENKEENKKYDISFKELDFNTLSAYEKRIIQEEI